MWILSNIAHLLTEPSSQERAFYIQELSKGMNGPLNYYRTTLHRYEEEKGMSSSIAALT